MKHLPAIAWLGLAALSPVLALDTIEGFGAGATGGTAPCVVTSLADSGSGTLRACLSQSGRNITFDVAGTIRPADRYVVPSSTTIDGLSAPAPGITIDGSAVPGDRDIFRIVASPGQVTSNIVIRHIRVAGVTGSNNDAFSLWGMDGNPAGLVRDVAISHVSLRDATDGDIDFAGNVQNVTLQWSIIGYTPAAASRVHNYSNLLASSPGPRNISIHHCVYVRGQQRSPQADKTTVLDFRNNVVRHWNNYGARFRDGTTANFVNNDYYTSFTSKGQKALIVVPLNESASTPDAGPIWVRGNLIPQQPGHESLGLATAPYSAAPVATDPADGLEALLLASVGPRDLDAADRELLDAARVYSQGSPPGDVPNLIRTDKK